jgi:hypothetical protein
VQGVGATGYPLEEGPGRVDMTAMTLEVGVEQRAAVRRALSRALVGALCVAAATAIVAIITGDFDETDGRVIGTSLGFAIFSATAASGASLRFKDSENLRTLGLATMALSAISFVFFLVAMWNDGGEEVWRWFGSAALAAFACSHASLVSGASRSSDSVAIRNLGTASMALGAIDAFCGIIVVSGAVDEVADDFGQAIAVLVVLLMLSTALPPILRRLQRTAPAPDPLAGVARPAAEARISSHLDPAPAPLATEVLATAERIEALNADPGNRAPEISRECERLRALARSYSR